MIGGLFTLYGVLLFVYSFFMSPAEIDKAAGININLWMGIGMLILGLLFLLWVRLAPLQAPRPERDRHDPPDDALILRELLDRQSALKRVFRPSVDPDYAARARCTRHVRVASVDVSSSAAPETPETGRSCGAVAQNGWRGEEAR